MGDNCICCYNRLTALNIDIGTGEFDGWIMALICIGKLSTMKQQIPEFRLPMIDSDVGQYWINNLIDWIIT